MAFETVLYEKVGAVAKITMNRPEVRNAQNVKMIEELCEALKMAEQDDDVRVVILAGAGPSFSAGHDLKSEEARRDMQKYPDGLSVAERMKLQEDLYLNTCFLWRDTSKPTIAQVQGHCIMGGFKLATACDLIIASEDAQFVDRSVVMGGSGVQYFSHPWELGARKAKEFLFTGEPISAEEGWRLGLVNRVVPREKLDEETMNLAQQIARNDPFILKLAKAAVNDTLDIMGQRNAILSAFKVHQLGRAYGMELGAPKLPPQMKQ